MVYEKPEKHRNILSVNEFLLTFSLLIIMPKPEIHPNWLERTPVLCDGKPLCFIGSTKSKLEIDIWFANHPFYSNTQVMIDSEGRVEKFMKKYQLDVTPS